MGEVEGSWAGFRFGDDPLEFGGDGDEDMLSYWYARIGRASLSLGLSLETRRFKGAGALA